MIEGVNSSIAASNIVRAVAEQVSVARANTLTSESVQQIAKAPYVSPYIRVDVNFDKAVLQIRDGDTGDVVRQFPSESQLQAYRRAQSAQANAKALAETRVATESATPDVPQVDVPDVQVRESSVPVTASTQERVAPTPTSGLSSATTINTQA